MFGRKPATKASDLHPTSRKAAGRLARLAESDVLRYADNACSEANRLLGQYQRGDDPLALDEAYTQGLVLVAALEGLLARR